MGSQKIKTPCFEIIQQLLAEQPLKPLLQISGLSRSGFYKRNSLQLVLKTLDQLKDYCEEVILHSDQGCQYTRSIHKRRLEAQRIRGNYSRKGSCLDNVCMESFFSHLKTEGIYWKTRAG